MELRVIHIGKTLYVRVPKQWADLHGVDEGSIFTMSENMEGALVFKPKGEQR